MNKNEKKIELNNDGRCLTEVGVPYLDAIEMVSRTAMFSTCSDVQFEVLEDSLERAEIKDFNWKAFVENIERNNDIILKIKGCVKLLSMYGRIVNYWDIIDGEITIGTANTWNNATNNITRINQTKPVAALFVYDPIYIPSYMSGLTLKELRTENYTQRIILTQSFGAKDDKTGEIDGFIPWQEFVFDVPPILKYYYGNYPSRETALRTNYGIISAKEFYNADIVDFERNQFKLPDCYPVYWLLNLINGEKSFLKFLYDEPNLDFTTRMGKFNLSDVEPSQYVMEQQKKMVGRNVASNVGDYVKAMNRLIMNQEEKRQNPLKAKMFITTHESGNEIKTMQTTFDGTRHIDYLNNLVQFIYKSSGYSWTTEDSAAMRTNEGVQTVNKLSYETTKMKVSLLNRLWREFFSDIAYGYYHQAHFNDADVREKAMQVKKDFYKVIKFNVISNLLNDYLHKDERIITLKDAGLMSNDRAMELVNEDMTKEEIAEMTSQVETEQEKQMQELFAQEEVKDESSK